MTRLTNFGRKRKYEEAGFATEPTLTSNERKDAKTSGDDEQSPKGGIGVEAKKKRPATTGLKKANITKKRGPVKSVAISGYRRHTEQRRLTRILDRQAETVCFACREKGHAAKNCTKAAAEGADGQKNLNSSVGMCYRCGSRNHTLSRCKAPEDPLNPLPFASCFVCSRKGHLASACPQNKEKGIYPNGGSCKLCGERTHLAKNCELRKKDAAGTAATTIFGVGNGAGADEDDFHIFKRKNTAISKDEKKEDRRGKQLDVKAGLHTGTVKAFGKNLASKSKKVVFF